MKTKLDKFIKLLLISALFFISSCTKTKELWNDKKHYDETIKELVTKNNKIIFIGQDYQYTFDETDLMKSILKWSGKPKMVILIRKFEVFDDETVKVEAEVASLYGEENPYVHETLALSKDEINFLKKLEFIDRNNPREGTTYGNYVFYKKINLEGERSKKEQISGAQISSLNKKYKINVVQKNNNPTTFDHVKKVFLTPVKIVEDTGMIIFGVAMGTLFVASQVVVGIPMEIISNVKKSHKDECKSQDKCKSN